LDWTISALGDDDSLKIFLEAIPGFFNSKLVKYPDRDSDFPEERLQKFSDALSGFLDRTWSSNSIDDSEKLRRLDISMNAMNQIGVSHIWHILHKIYFAHWDEVPHTLEMGHTLARWCTSSDLSVAQFAQATVIKILAGMRERDDSWITLAARISGIPEHDLRDNIAYGIDNMLLSILIQYVRPTLRSLGVLDTLSKLDIRNTLPRLQHDFCAKWNEVVQEARDRGPHSVAIIILRCVRHLYIALHQGTDAPSTVLSASTREGDRILYKSSTYPFCKLPNHRPDSIARMPVPNSCDIPLPTPPDNSPDALSPSTTDGSTVPQQAKQTNIIARLPVPSNPTTTSEIGETPQGPDANPLTNPAYSSPYPTDDSPTGGVAATTQTITLTATLSHPQEGNEQQDTAAPCVESGICQVLSTASTRTPTLTLAPVPTSTPGPPVIDMLKSSDSGAASASNSLLTATSVVVGFSDPVSPAPSHVLSSPSTEFISLLRSTTSSYDPTGDATLPHLARGLSNSANMCVANAVLQILVRSPPFWNLFKKLGSLKGQHGGGIPEADGGVLGVMPLVDATTRFIGEFLVEEKESPPMQRPPRQVLGETREDEEKKGHNTLDPFDPTYMYDAMKEKRQLKDFLVRFCVT
jgi:hypothetical protein